MSSSSGCRTGSGSGAGRGGGGESGGCGRGGGVSPRGQGGRGRARGTDRGRGRPGRPAHLRGCRPRDACDGVGTSPPVPLGPDGPCRLLRPRKVSGSGGREDVRRDAARPRALFPAVGRSLPRILVSRRRPPGHAARSRGGGEGRAGDPETGGRTGAGGQLLPVRGRG